LGGWGVGEEEKYTTVMETGGNAGFTIKWCLLAKNSSTVRLYALRKMK